MNHFYCTITAKMTLEQISSGEKYMFYAILIIIISVVNLVIMRKPKDDILQSSRVEKKKNCTVSLNIVQLTSVCGAIITTY